MKRQKCFSAGITEGISETAIWSEIAGTFGSVARRATDASGVDVLAEFDRPVGYCMIGLQEHLESVLGCKVDVGTRTVSSPHSGRSTSECVHVT